MKLSTIINIALCAAAINAQTPEPTIWANEWYAEFTEKLHMPYRGDSSTTGKWWYSATQKAFRVDRENGNYDRYCGLTRNFSNEPCSQIVNGGVRYLWFPKEKYCCNCCSNEDGCGIVKPDWTKPAAYLDTKTDSQGVTYNEWNL